MVAWTLLLGVSLFLLVPSHFGLAADRVFIDGFTEVDEIRDDSGIDDRDLPALIKDIINFALDFVAIVALGVLIWGGFLYIIDLGEGERAKKAKKLILYAVIGLIVIGISAIVVNVIINTAVIGNSGT